MEPPRLLIQSCGGAPAVSGKNSRPVVTLSSTTIAFSGSMAPRIEAMEAGVMAPVGSAGRRRADRAELDRERLEGGVHVVFQARQLRRPGLLRHQQTRLVGIGEERDRLARADQ